MLVCWISKSQSAICIVVFHGCSSSFLPWWISVESDYIQSLSSVEDILIEKRVRVDRMLEKDKISTYECCPLSYAHLKTFVSFYIEHQCHNLSTSFVCICSSDTIFNKYWTTQPLLVQDRVRYCCHNCVQRGNGQNLVLGPLMNFKLFESSISSKSGFATKLLVSLLEWRYWSLYTVLAASFVKFRGPPLWKVFQISATWSVCCTQ